MDLNRLGTGPKLAAGAAIVLFVLMFLPWFSISQESVVDLDVSPEEALEFAEDYPQIVSIDADETTFSVNAWSAFGFIDLVLLLAIVAAIGFALLRASGNNLNVPLAPSVIVLILAGLALLLVLYSLINPPAFFGRAFGVFLGLIATAATTVGAYLWMQEEGTSVRGEFDKVSSSTGPSSGRGPDAGGGTTGGTAA